MRGSATRESEASGALLPVLEASDLGLILLDGQARVILWNAWMERASGIQRERAVGATLAELFPQVSHGRLPSAVDEALRRGMASLLARSVSRSPLPLHCDGQLPGHHQRMEQIVTVKPIAVEGEARHCLLQIVDITGAANREQMLRGQAAELRQLADVLDARARDLVTSNENVTHLSSELRAANARLRSQNDELVRRNQELSEFVFIAHHDLQTPLRDVILHSQVLERDLAERLEPNLRRSLSFVINGARRIRSLIEAVLRLWDVARVETIHQTVSCADVLDTATANLEREIEGSGARITSDDLPQVVGVTSQLVNLFENLIDNAIRFRGDEAPQVHVGVERRGGVWCFSVRDNGIGFEPRHAERIFELFGRLHAADRYPGTGVGLAIAKRVVENFGGSIWAESKRGCGSTFYFTLPAGGLGSEVPRSGT